MAYSMEKERGECENADFLLVSSDANWLMIFEPFVRSGLIVGLKMRLKNSRFCIVSISFL